MRKTRQSRLKVKTPKDMAIDLLERAYINFAFDRVMIFGSKSQLAQICRRPVKVMTLSEFKRLLKDVKEGNSTI